MATELLGRQLLALWVMSDGKDSVLLLKEFMEALPEARVSAVRNIYRGIPETFSISTNHHIRPESPNAAANASTFLPSRNEWRTRSVTTV